MSSTLKQRAQEARDAGFKPAQLAKAAGVTTGAVSQWLSGDTKSLKAESALGLAVLTGWSPTWWTTGKGPRDLPKKEPVNFQERVPSPSQWQTLQDIAALPHEDREKLLADIHDRAEKWRSITAEILERYKGNE